MSFAIHFDVCNILIVYTYYKQQERMLIFSDDINREFLIGHFTWPSNSYALEKVLLLHITKSSCQISSYRYANSSRVGAKL